MDNKVIFNNLDNTMNNKIYERNLASEKMQPNFSFASQPTRYTKFLLTDSIKHENKELYSYYNVENTFYPGTNKPHFSGFSNNVDNESILRNQIYALKKSDIHMWAPSSNSVLYNETENMNNQMNSLLFREEKFNDFNPNFNEFIGNEIFNNSTRYQLKDL
jgi:hypothetical protein